MKKLTIIFVLLCSLLGVFCGCTKQEKFSSKVDTNNTDSTTGNVPDDKNEVTSNSGNSRKAIVSDEGGNSNQVAQSQTWDYPLMVMLEDKLYVDTGEISKMARCGNMDFTFTSHVKSGEPKKNGQTNFDSPIEGQYGIRENRIELYYDDAWHIFAFQEDDFEGVAMHVTKCDNKGAVLTVYNNTQSDIGYGEDFILERYNEDNATWESITTKSEYGFHDILNILEKESQNIVTVNWKDYYGELPQGSYRIVKEFIDYQKDAEEYNTHSLMAEFKVTERTNNDKDL